MNNIDQYLQNDLAGYKGYHAHLIRHLPAFYRLLGQVFNDPLLPARWRPLVLATIGYLVLSADIIPESQEGPEGYADDIWLCAYLADLLRQESGSEILTSNWNSSTPLLALMDEILIQEEALIGGQKWLILKSIGL